MLSLHESVCVPRPLKRREEAEDTNWVKTVEHLQLQLYLKTSGHLCSSSCHVFIVALEPMGQVISLVVQGCVVVCFDRIYDAYRLFGSMATSLVALIYCVTTVVGLTVEDLSDSVSDI